MIKLLLCGISMFTSFWGNAQKQNSFSPGNLWLDNNGVHINAHGGGMIFYNSTYYWFGEHKTQGKAGNVSNVGVHVYSSKNLYNWKDEGIALTMHDDTTSLFVKGCIVERPKVMYNKKTKTFVMWFHHELKGQDYKAALTGLATSKNITGPYTYMKSVNPNAGKWPLNFPEALQNIKDTLKPAGIKLKTVEGEQLVKQGYFLRRDFKKGQMARDMTLYVDDDGKTYHIHASENNQTLHIAELTDDYQNFTGKYARVLEGKANEAPAIFKRNNKYYMITSGTTGWKPNPARLAVADNILGPWQELGDPSRGNDDKMKTTFWSQSTYILPVAGKKDAYIFMGDRWNGDNLIDSKYIWLPITFENEKPVLRWYDEWDFSVFKKKKNQPSAFIDSQTPKDAAPFILDNAYKNKWKLDFSDEFNDNTIDKTKWTVENTFRKRVDVTLFADENQVEEKDGNAYIYYRKSNINDTAYMAGRFNSKGKYAPTYGFLECRMHIVKPNGHQTAFWMMPEGDGMKAPQGVDGTANDGAEIDIIEGTKADAYSLGLHWDGYAKPAHKSNGSLIKTPCIHNSEYHVYGFEWTPTYLRFYYDGKVVKEMKDPKLIPQVAHYIYFSGSCFGENNWLDGDIRKNEFIQKGCVDKAYIDYIRVFKKN